MIFWILIPPTAATWPQIAIALPDIAGIAKRLEPPVAGANAKLPLVKPKNQKHPPINSAPDSSKLNKSPVNIPSLYPSFL